MIVFPTPAFIAGAEVAEPIVDSAVETNYRAPITFVKVVSPAAPGPVAGRPQISWPRRIHPCPRHPVIIIPIPCPIAGRPDVAFARTDGLLVDRQFRLTHRLTEGLRFRSGRRNCRSTSSPSVLAKATSGRPAIGHGMGRIITGCRGDGWMRRGQDICGRPATGPGAAGDTTFTKVIGAR